MSAPTRLLLRFAANVTFIWALATYRPEYLLLQGGIFAALAVGALLTLMNILIRPILAVLTFPLKLFGILLAYIALNAAFLWLLTQVTVRFDTQIALLEIRGGFIGWSIVAIAISLLNWFLKHLPKESGAQS